MVSEPEQATAIASVRECFRPLSGIKVSEQIHSKLGSYNAICFRPLSGIKVSEL